MDKIIVVWNIVKKVFLSVYIVFKYIIIVKNISFNNYSKISVWWIGFVCCYGV